MALDIEIDLGNNRKTEESIPLHINEHAVIMKVLENDAGYPILKKNLADYFGESEVYLNELNDLKSEIVELKLLFRADNSDTINVFLNKFLELVESAIKQRKTIKFIGD